MQRGTMLSIGIVVLLIGAMTIYLVIAPFSQWSPGELKTIQSLSLANLRPLSPDPSNPLADDPRAVALGQKLFFDTRFSANGRVSCASCHMPELNFQDARAHGRGMADTVRRTPSIVGTAYLTSFFWDGRADSQWRQALSPLEGQNEHGGDRAQYAHLMAHYYRGEYEELFGALPDMKNIPEHASPNADAGASSAWAGMSGTEQRAVTTVFENMGKSIAAYERKLMPGAARFDQYASALGGDDVKTANATFSSDEVAGLRLFIGKAGCVQCHNTPLFTDGEYHNTGVPQDFQTEYDIGHGGGAFKTPSLRVTQFVSPFMHNAWYTNLAEVLDHYNRAPAAMIGQSELKPLNLSAIELNQLEAFLLTLRAPVNAPPQLSSAPNP